MTNSPPQTAKVSASKIAKNFERAKGNFDRLKKRALAMLARNGGQMSYSTMLRNLPIDAPTLKRLLTTLKMCDMIEDGIIPSGKAVILLKKAA